MKIEDAQKKANEAYPVSEMLYELKRKAFVRGYLSACSDLDPTPKSFYAELAEALRKLWPPGEKDGKWPWRDSVDNLTRRLKTLWDIRNLGERTIDECIMAAQRYLAQFQDNAKYMQTLKYFILKQDDIIDKNGKHKYINVSKFADLLESNPNMDNTMSEWTELFESSNTIEQGRLV